MQKLWINAMVEHGKRKRIINTLKSENREMNVLLIGTGDFSVDTINWVGEQSFDYNPAITEVTSM